MKNMKNYLRIVGRDEMKNMKNDTKIEMAKDSAKI